MVVDRAATGTEVLLVEDDQDIREALGDILAESGYRVHTAEHGARALALLKAGLRPAIILLDLMMPVMDGWELLERLHGLGALADIPVVTVSASRSPTPPGALGSLPKPLDVDDLLRVMARLLGPAAAPTEAFVPAAMAPPAEAGEARAP